jgi:hypothetical protein
MEKWIRNITTARETDPDFDNFIQMQKGEQTRLNARDEKLTDFLNIEVQLLSTIRNEVELKNKLSVVLGQIIHKATVLLLDKHINPKMPRLMHRMLAELLNRFPPGPVWEVFHDVLGLYCPFSRGWSVGPEEYERESRRGLGAKVVFFKVEATKYDDKMVETMCFYSLFICDSLFPGHVPLNRTSPPVPVSVDQFWIFMNSLIPENISSLADRHLRIRIATGVLRCGEPPLFQIFYRHTRDSRDRLLAISQLLRRAAPSVSDPICTDRLKAFLELCPTS